MKASRPSRSRTVATVIGGVIRGPITVAEITQARAVTAGVEMRRHRPLTAEIRGNVHAGLLKFSFSV